MALGRNRAVFPDDMPTLSALPWEEREKILSSMGNDGEAHSGYLLFNLHVDYNLAVKVYCLAYACRGVTIMNNNPQLDVELNTHLTELPDVIVQMFSKWEVGLLRGAPSYYSNGNEKNILLVITLVIKRVIRDTLVSRNLTVCLTFPKSETNKSLRTILFIYLCRLSFCQTLTLGNLGSVIKSLWDQIT